MNFFYWVYGMMKAGKGKEDKQKGIKPRETMRFAWRPLFKFCLNSKGSTHE